MERFINVKLSQSGEKYHICYRSGIYVYEEELDNGIFRPVYWNAAGFPSDTCAIGQPFSEISPKMNGEDFPFPQSFRLEANGEDLQCDWKWDNMTETETKKGHLVSIKLTHARAGISVTVNTLIDGTAVFVRYLTIENNTPSPVNVGNITVMGGSLQTNICPDKLLSQGGELYTLGYIKDSCWANEGNFKWVSLPNAEYSVYGRGRRERHRHPMYILRNNATGECFITQFAWSGNYAFRFDLDDEIDIRTANKTMLSYAVQIDTPSPSIILSSNESYKTPAVHTGMILGDTDKAVNEMNDHIRKSVLSPAARGRRGWIEEQLAVNNAQNSIDTIIARIDRTASLGAEVFYIDAGWYTPKNKEGEWRYRVGDWTIGDGRFPDGFDYVINYIHSKGMLWGLWAEPERIGYDSENYKSHSGLIATDKFGKASRECMARISDKEVCEWMEKQIRHIIKDYKLDFYRLDYNIGEFDADSYTLKSGVLEHDQLRYYKNLYDMYARLRADFPDVIFENCAGGGGRTDLGQMEYFDHTWISDWHLMPRAFRILNGMTMALPPEACDRLVGEMEGYLRGDIETQMRLSIFTRPTVSCLGAPDGYTLNPEQFGIVKHHIEIYKNFYRPFIEESRIYHHNFEISGKEPQGFGALEVSSKDKSKGMAGIFRLSGNAPDDYTIRLRGIDISKAYNVTFDNQNSSCKISGFELSKGITIRLCGQNTSELILYSAE